MSIGNWYRIGTVAVTNGSVNVVGTGTFWTSQCNPGDRFTVDGQNWYEINTITDDTHLALLSVGGSGAFAGATAANLAYAVDRNFTNNLNANIAASVASLVAQYQASSNGPLAGLFGNGVAATPGIAFLNEASTGLFHPAAGIAALAVQGAEFLRAVGTAAGVPAMLGLGQTAPANALDILTVNNALYGARIQNGSAGAAARAALQLGNTSAAAQVLNLGVNGAGFTANGVLAPSRGFVEGPNGVDFASGVTAGDAFAWGFGAGYTKQIAADYQGNLRLVGGKLGIGMAPVNVLDITQSVAGGSAVQLLNSNVSVAASANIVVSNGTNTTSIGQSGINNTGGGALSAGGGYVFGNGGGLSVLSNSTIKFGTLSALYGQFDASGSLNIGTSTSRGPVHIDKIAFTTGGGWNEILGVFDGSTNKGLSFGYLSASQTGVIAAYTNGPASALAFWGFNGAWGEYGRFDGSGNLLVGTTSGNTHTFEKIGSTENISVLQVNDSTGVGRFFVADVRASGWSASATGVYVGKNSTSGRSVNLAGTLNASGADYAEYRKLIAALYGAVPKGALLGYNAAGLMTNVFADATGRVLPKSTAPSYVGNDTWGTEENICAAYGVAAPGARPSVVHEPIAPAVVADPGAEATEEAAAAYAAYLAAVAIYPELVAAYAEYQTAEAAYQTRLTAFNAALETERVKWDRIALCGVVPVNIAGLTSADIGKYLVPCAAADGTITATAIAKADLTLMQYIDSFGTIELIGADGRPLVNVKSG